MRRIVANMFMTLDGVMQAPGGPEEDPTGGFKQIDCKISTTGVIIATYLRDGDIRTGSVALEKTTKA
jgi:hypothetical protein